MVCICEGCCVGFYRCIENMMCIVFWNVFGWCLGKWVGVWVILFLIIMKWNVMERVIWGIRFFILKKILNSLFKSVCNYLEELKIKEVVF